MGNSIVKLRADVIKAHILDPENNPLPTDCKEQFDIVMQAARLLDDYPQDSQIKEMLRRKYNCSETCARVNIRLAKELFKSKFDFDWDFWRAWEIRDQIELIKIARQRQDLKEWNNAKKVLHQLIGEKPEGLDDPRRMEKTVINIQVNNNKESKTFSISEIRDMNEEEKNKIFNSIDEAIEVADAVKIMNS